jgi:HKD family nuclease
VNNHEKRIRQLFEDSDDIVLASPFLMPDFASFLNATDLSNLNRLHLVTTLVPKSPDQITKANSLFSLINFPNIESGRINCQFSINNRLHGKIYIFKRKNEYVAAIITSANFTDAGLSKNHEWGIEIYNPTEIENLEHSILETISVPNISFDEVREMKLATDEFSAKLPGGIVSQVDLDLTKYISYKNLSLKIGDNVQFWIKPIGETNNPILPHRVFDEPTRRLNFSKTKPTGVKLNDILITYGVGTRGKILSVYRVTTSPEKMSESQLEKEEMFERWPWYVVGENLTPDFGANWFENNILAENLMDEYLAQNPEMPITAVGGRSLGALQWGADKINLAPDFARFVLQNVIAQQ